MYDQVKNCKSHSHIIPFYTRLRALKKLLNIDLKLIHHWLCSNKNGLNIFKTEIILRNPKNNSSSQGTHIITGDFNIDLTNESLEAERKRTFNLEQHGTQPTRKSKSLIDQIISNQAMNFENRIVVF